MRLICFARTPEPGRAKTRLIPALGADGAARLHARMVEFTLQRANVAAWALDASVELHATPNADAPFFSELADRSPRLELKLQRGHDLGARMHHALDGDGPALLFGCDCPGWAPDDLVAAAGALDQGLDAVFGPATDGGYYLVGMRVSDAALFADMPWGTSSVMAATRARLTRLGLSWHELPRYPDIDVPGDLVHLPPSLHSTHGSKEDSR